MTTPFHIELPDELARRLADLAAVEGTTVEALLTQLAAEFLDHHEAFNAAIAAGEADVAAGRVVAHEDIMAEMHEWARALRRRVRTA